MGRISQVIIAERNSIVSAITKIDSRMAAVEALAVETAIGVTEIKEDLGTVAEHIQVGDVQRRVLAKFNAESRERVRGTTMMLLQANELSQSEAEAWLGEGEKGMDLAPLSDLKSLKRAAPTLQLCGSQGYGNQQLRTILGAKRPLTAEGAVNDDDVDGSASSGGGMDTSDGR